jgi:cytochrome c553
LTVVKARRHPGGIKARREGSFVIASTSVRHFIVFIVFAALLAALPAFPDAARADTLEEKARMCGGCHGEDGVPQEKTTPIIWGQHQGYLYLNLRDYKRGDRKDDQMTPVVDLLEREDIMALAEYFSKKKWPALRQPPAPRDVAIRAQRANGSVGCTGCHQDSYLGEGTQPRLAGQRREYLLQSMLDFRTRKRANNPGMSDLMLATSQDDLTALAEYLAGL